MMLLLCINITQSPSYASNSVPSLNRLHQWTKQHTVHRYSLQSNLLPPSSPIPFYFQQISTGSLYSPDSDFWFITCGQSVPSRSSILSSLRIKIPSYQHPSKNNNSYKNSILHLFLANYRLPTRNTSSGLWCCYIHSSLMSIIQNLHYSRCREIIVWTRWKVVKLYVNSLLGLQPYPTRLSLELGKGILGFWYYLDGCLACLEKFMHLSPCGGSNE